MRVLFLAPANSIHTVRWVNALSEKNCKVCLISLPNHVMSEDKIAPNVQVLYLPFSVNKGYYLNAPFVKKIVCRFCPDVINAHYASGYGTLARIAQMPHLILSVWGSDVYSFPYESEIKMCIIKKNLRYAEKIASTSLSMSYQVQKLIGKRDISITPFGIDINVFKKKPAKKKEKQEFTIGIVKTLSYNYGIDYVIKAFKIFDEKLSSHDIKRQLYIYGEGEEKSALIQLCMDLNLSDKIKFFGKIENDKVPEALNEMDLVCFGSRLESFGVSAVEAMACELPVIATDAEGFKEVLEPGVTGYIVHQDAPEEMAMYIMKLFYEPEQRKKMGREGRKRVVKYYNWEENVRKMIELYNSINMDREEWDN